MSEERIKEVFSDEEFVKGLLELETPGEVCAALKEKEIDVTEADVLQVREFLLKRSSGELTDEELEDVAGGCIFCVVVSTFFTVGSIGVAAGITDALLKVNRRRW